MSSIIGQEVPEGETGPAQKPEQGEGKSQEEARGGAEGNLRPDQRHHHHVRGARARDRTVQEARGLCVR